VQELLSAKIFALWRGELILNVEATLAGAGRVVDLHNVTIRLQVNTKKESTRQHITCAGRLEMLRQSMKHNAELPMFMLLNATRSFEATDPRDRLFALVGLASDVGEDFVDYTKDVKEVVTELSRRFLSGTIECVTSPLDMLSLITRPNGEDKDLPSWVMDW
jgi:hypothetical protein